MRLVLSKKKLALVLGFLLVLGCEEPFSPKGDFREEPVVYSIISNLSDTHLARVYRTYDPPAYDPFEHTSDNPITGAIIRLQDGATQWTFRDTVVARADSSRYATPINAYVYSPLQVERGKTYSLFIQPPGGPSSTATTTVPEIGFISVHRNQAGVTSPRSVSNRFFGVLATVPTRSKGFLIRFHVTFDVFENSVWVPHRVEVPYFIIDVGLPEEQLLYHEVQRSIDGAGTPGTKISHFLDFSVDSYSTVISRIHGEYGSGAVRFKEAIFTLTQLEKEFYNYYNISRGFRDPNSIRIDEPDYGNIVGGAGIFGAFAVDSAVISLPPTL